MRKSTIIGCLIGLLSLTLSAQSTQPSTLVSTSGTTNVEMQKKPVASLQELLARYQNLGKRHGAVSEYFSQEEQRILRSYFNSQRPVDGANTKVNATSPKDRSANKTQYTPLHVISDYTDKFGNSTGIDYSVSNKVSYKQNTPTFLAPEALTAANQAEILAAAVYGLNLRTPCGNDFGSFPLTGPYSLDPIATNTNPIYGGDFDASGTLYAFNGTDSTLLTIDITTGAETTVAPITGLLPSETLRGIAWNESNSTMYLLAGQAEVGSIYTVDLTTGVATLVGSSTITGWLPIWLAIDSNGNAFMADVGLDSLFSVDLTTGAATLVGALGININFAQDADFDPDTDTLYMGAYLGGGVNVFASVDTATGVATSLGTVNADCAELGIVAIKGDGGGGGGSADPCAQTQVSNAFENGYFMEAGGQLVANDFLVSPSTINFSVESITANLFSQGGIDSVDILFFEDNAGVPGIQIGSTLANIVPTSQTVIGTAFGFDIHETIIDLPAPIDFAGSGTGEEKVYWVQIVGHPTVPGTQMAWEVTSASVIGNPVAFDNLTGTWGTVPGEDGVFTINGVCTLVPCPQPTDLTVSNITETTADLAWSAEPNATTGYEWFVFNAGDDPTTDTPVDSGITPAGTTTATADGLTNGTSYDFYVSSDCGATGTSFLSGPVMFETLITPPACGGKFYDTGGPTGDYQNSENVTTTITPVNPGEQVTVTFTAFDVEANWDALYVYDGPDASSPLISSGNPPTNSGFPAGGFYGTSIPGPFTSSHPSGALTFVFMSDSSVPRAGWEADVTCALSPPPNDMIVNSIDVDEIGFPYTDPGVHMPAATVEDGNPSGCDLTGANGVWYNFVPEGDGTATASITTPGGASSVTFYTAPDENATETDLVLVPQNSNQCVPGTSASISTVAGQAYYVFVLNTGAITDIVIDGTNLGVSENSIAGFSYYPNPTTGVLNLRSVDNIEQVSLYNLLGQRVMDNTLDSTAAQVDISGLSSGTYIMKVTVNGQIGTYKVLKD